MRIDLILESTPRMGGPDVVTMIVSDAQHLHRYNAHMRQAPQTGISVLRR
jgi:hypothetical protein